MCAPAYDELPSTDAGLPGRLRVKRLQEPQLRGWDVREPSAAHSVALADLDGERNSRRSSRRPCHRHNLSSRPVRRLDSLRC